MGHYYSLLYSILSSIFPLIASLIAWGLIAPLPSFCNSLLVVGGAPKSAEVMGARADSGSVCVSDGLGNRGLPCCFCFVVSVLLSPLFLLSPPGRVAWGAPPLWVGGRLVRPPSWWGGPPWVPLAPCPSCRWVSCWRLACGGGSPPLSPWGRLGAWGQHRYRFFIWFHNACRHCGSSHLLAKTLRLNTACLQQESVSDL